MPEGRLYPLQVEAIGATAGDKPQTVALVACEDSGVEEQGIAWDIARALANEYDCDWQVRDTRTGDIDRYPGLTSQYDADMEAGVRYA